MTVEFEGSDPLNFYVGNIMHGFFDLQVKGIEGLLFNYFYRLIKT